MEFQSRGAVDSARTRSGARHRVRGARPTRTEGAGGIGAWESTPERGGRAQRYFHVTEEGLRAAQETRRKLSKQWRFVLAGSVNSIRTEVKNEMLGGWIRRAFVLQVAYF